MRVFIANRGEIALRVLRACHARGFDTVAAYSKVDEQLLHLRYATDTVCIGARSYLDVNQMTAAALSRGCDAVHPGYGFLSENAAFAELVEDKGMRFLGPTAEHIAVMGDKSRAREVMAGLGVPVLPGSQGALTSASEAARLAEEIGYPVMLKASAGGGGRGISLVHDEKALFQAFERVGKEAHTFFGDHAMYLEKYVNPARHIEIQVMGDGEGTVVHFGARECSLQRRNQKVIEEAPPPGITPAALESLADTCTKALSELGYRSAGTIEFLYTGEDFYFIEMNTRIQVEHPVTEMITGYDLVDMQLGLAVSEPLPSQGEIGFSGHAIECRINAEDSDFMPSSGEVTSLLLPGGAGVRVDSHLYQGYVVPHQYDSLVGKLITHGENRPAAIARMKQALHELNVRGIETNRPLHQALLDHPDVIAGNYHTSLTGE